MPTDGTLSTTACEAALWTTGQNLRNNPELRSQLEPGGPLVVHGLQGSPADLVRNANTPPTVSYFVDYADTFHDPRASGHIGSVRIYTTPCAPAVAMSSPAVAANPAVGGRGGGACVCQPPLLPGPLPGQCVCPKGTVLDGNECVPQTCPAPLVYNPVAGACVCLPGRKCVCPPPLIAGPVPGECVWPLQTKQCVPTTGSLIIEKTVTTHGTLIPWPAGTLFPMTLTCSPPPFSASFSLAANGTYTANNIPFGSTCTVAEALPAFPPNLCPRGTVPMWSPPPTITPASVVINGTTVTVIVHNSVTCEKRDGTLSVTKIVDPDPLHIGSTLPFPMTVTCTNPAASYPLNVHGNTSTVPFNVPFGSHCTVTETQPALPAGCVWLPPVFAPPGGVTIASGLNQETVTNGYRCREACPPPQVMNVDGICVCPPPMVPGPVAGTCICPQGTTLVDGKCVPVDSCQPPLVMIPGAGCGCPPGTVLRGKECVRPIVCHAPLIPNAAGTECVCRDGLILRNGKCVEEEKPRREQTCQRGYVWNGDMCVRRKTEPKVERSRERPGFQKPRGMPGPGRRGGLGGGRGGGMPGR